MGPIEVREYLTRDGKSPYRQWLGGLEVQTRARVQARILRFELGNFGDVKPVGDGIYEARFMFGAGYRLYFARDGAALVLLFCGGDKQTQRSDINKAKKYLRDYRERADG